MYECIRVSCVSCVYFSSCTAVVINPEDKQVLYLKESYFH